MGTVRVSSFGIHQTSKMVAVLYFCLALVIVPFIIIASLIAPNHSLSILFLIFIPFLYAILGYIFTAIGCFIYNLLGGTLGGFEITLTDVK